MLALASKVFCHMSQFCGHDMIQKRIKIAQVSNSEPKRKSLDSDEWNSIRVVFNYDQLYENYTDKYKCTKDKIGEKISFGFEGEFEAECTEDNLLTEEKIDAIIGTLENARKIIESLLKVKRFNGLMPIFEIYGYGNVPDINVSDVDLYIMIFPRAFNPENSLLAAAAATIQDSVTMRPVQGFVLLNVLETPTSIQSNETADQSFLSTCIHEIFHALGIASGTIMQWHSHDNNEPYETKYISDINIGGVNRIVINSPYSHNFAVKHFGVEHFKSGNTQVRSGIILEDAGGSGTAYSHPEWLLYFNDLMVGISSSSTTFPFDRITELSLSLLMDTGYYKVDYTIGMPLWWGSKETNKGEFIKNFNTGPPQTTFPSNYLVDAKHNQSFLSAGFDYSYIGRSPHYPYEIPEYVKQNLDWYNPNGSEYYGHPVIEFQRVALPITQCENGTAAINVKNNDADCINYTLGDKKVEFYSDSLGLVTCTALSAEVVGNDGRIIICPDPDDFARRVILRNKNVFESDPFDGIHGEKKGIEPWAIAVIIIACFIIIAVLGIVIFCIRSRNKNDDENMIP